MDLSRRQLNLARLLAVGLVAVIALRLAWVSDDALITLRTALNLTHGWGAGYNATEVVQGFTHPLWFLLWSAIGSLTNQWILGMLAMSIAFTVIATAFIAWQARTLGRLIVVIGLLVFSNAFMEYATSGLENPLAFALIAALMTLTMSARAMGEGGPHDLRTRAPWAVAIGLVTAGVVLTRLDLVVVLAPVVIAVVVAHRDRWRVLLIGATAAVIPLIAWFAWSWATYRTLLPNTFLAKRNVDIPQFELVVQGVRYVWVSLINDPGTAMLLAVGIGAALAFGGWVLRSWAIGALAYIGYVVWIGGDFMAWRFLAVPAVIAAFALAVVSFARAEAPVRDNSTATDAASATVLVSCVLLVTMAMGAVPSSLADPQKQRWEWDQNLNGAVADERGYYIANGMTLAAMMHELSLAFTHPAQAAFGDGTGLSRTLREIDHSASEWPIADGTFTTPSEVGVVCGGTGNVGIAVGPTVHLIDPCALTDRFLAAQTYRPAEPFAWRMGHFHRAIPEGYEEAIRTGNPTKLADMEERFELEQLWSLIRR